MSLTTLRSRSPELAPTGAVAFVRDYRAASPATAGYGAWPWLMLLVSGLVFVAAVEVTQPAQALEAQALEVQALEAVPVSTSEASGPRILAALPAPAVTSAPASKPAAPARVKHRSHAGR